MLFPSLGSLVVTLLSLLSRPPAPLGSCNALLLISNIKTEESNTDQTHQTTNYHLINSSTSFTPLPPPGPAIDSLLARTTNKQIRHIHVDHPPSLRSPNNRFSYLFDQSLTRTQTTNEQIHRLVRRGHENQTNSSQSHRTPRGSSVLSNRIIASCSYSSATSTFHLSIRQSSRLCTFTNDKTSPRYISSEKEPIDHTSLCEYPDHHQRPLRSRRSTFT